MRARKKQFYTDIDGVLLDLDSKMRKHIAKNFNLKNLPLSSCYSLEDGYGITNSKFMLALSEAIKEPADFFPGAAEFVTSLKALKFQVIGLSTRYDVLAEVAVRRDAGYLELDDLIVVRTNAEKIPYFQPGGFYVDDMPTQAAEAAARGCHSYLMSRQYNWACKDLGGYTRVWHYNGLLAKVKVLL